MSVLQTVRRVETLRWNSQSAAARRASEHRQGRAEHGPGAERDVRNDSTRSRDLQDPCRHPPDYTESSVRAHSGSSMEEFGQIVAAAISVHLTQNHALSQFLYMIVRTAVVAVRYA